MKVDEPSLRMDYYDLILEPCWELVCDVFGKYESNMSRGKSCFCQFKKLTLPIMDIFTHGVSNEQYCLGKDDFTLKNFTAAVNSIKDNSKKRLILF